MLGRLARRAGVLRAGIAELEWPRPQWVREVSRQAIDVRWCS